MSEALLRRLLQEWVAEEYIVTEICEFEDEQDSLGQRIPHRDICRRSQESRLQGLQRVAPDRTDLQEVHRAALLALANLSPAESLYYWFARSSAHKYSGVASTSGIITFISVASSPNDRNA
jgi:hypothetical protein